MTYVTVHMKEKFYLTCYSSTSSEIDLGKFTVLLGKFTARWKIFIFYPFDY